MEFTDEIRLIFIKLDTFIALENDDQKREVLNHISKELKRNIMERISEENNQKNLPQK